MGEKAVHPNDNMESDEQQNENDENMVDEETYDDMPQEEFEALNSQMDALNSALDSIEQKNDNIYSELLVLLQANREIRQQLKMENGNSEGESAAAP